MTWRLPPVFVQAVGVAKEPVTSLAVVMFVEAVFQQVVVVVKVGVTLTTEGVAGTLDPVLPEIFVRVKVLVAGAAVVVAGRVLHVLVVRVPVNKPAVAALHGDGK